MDLTRYAHQTLALFGKSRAFSFEDLAQIVRRYEITLVEGFDQNAKVIVEGAVMPTPLQIKAEELYAQGGYTFIDIDTFEKAAAKAIEPKKTLMHLKLANNQVKITAYLQNDYIDDTLFLNILKLYRFGKEDFFENDTNRNITAALIRRFYKGYEHNHNIEYSPMGLLGAIEQNKDPMVLETIFSLEPIQAALRSDTNANDKTLQLFALHDASSQNILSQIIQSGKKELLLLVASREALEEKLEASLLEMNDPNIDNALASGKYRSDTTIQTLLKRGYGERLAASITLDRQLFEMLKHFCSIGLNPSLNEAMQRTLLQDPFYHDTLAKNTQCFFTKELLALNDTNITKLVYRYHDIADLTIETEGFETALAANPTTPRSILETIYAKNIDEANANLAKNPATPIEILYQLSFDMRYAQSVKANPSFGEYIKTTHAIGINQNL